MAFGGNCRASSNNNNSNGNTSVNQRRKKSDYCWNFNKGITCKYGKKCHFIECCSYCDAANHGVYQCSKLKEKTEAVGSSPMNKI